MVKKYCNHQNTLLSKRNAEEGASSSEMKLVNKPEISCVYYGHMQSAWVSPMSD